MYRGWDEGGGGEGRRQERRQHGGVVQVAGPMPPSMFHVKRPRSPNPLPSGPSAAWECSRDGGMGVRFGPRYIGPCSGSVWPRRDDHCSWQARDRWWYGQGGTTVVRDKATLNVS